MKFKDKTEKLVNSGKNLDSTRLGFYKVLKDQSIEGYNWQFAKDSFLITDNNKVLYTETSQHVTAVAKLLRIPKELWLLWANFVLILSKNKINKFDTKQKIEIFREAFEITIRPYLAEEAESAKIIKEECLNCGKLSFAKPLNRAVEQKIFCVQICQNCGLGIRYPRASAQQLAKIYREEEYFGGDNTQRGYFDYASEAPWRIEKAFRYLEKIEEVTGLRPDKTKALDIGSGYGYFLKALRDKGYSNLGIELAEDAVEFAQQNYGVKTVAGDVPTLVKTGKVKENSFDLITLWDVIEHFYDFNEDLGQISRLLRADGLIALRTNNIASVEFAVFGKFFHSIKYEHTFYYTKNSLKEIFKKFGIKEVSTWTHTHLFLSFLTQAEMNKINQDIQGGDIFFVGQKV